ncbi:bifunctional oligoribonuclease/PAP phosphatase NrnA [Candidatus Peregrinibacteria bacterium]|nr:MAG: bifunctional oligoribonuclease/PAP phosphatase NrnA [Candidatus Peregrinibacteria bacterium]
MEEYGATTTAPPEKQFSKAIATEIHDLIAKAQRIAIISHRSPDGDTSGSGLALRILLEDQQKMVTNVCGDPLPTSFQFLPNASLFVPDFHPEEFDLLLTVDAATSGQTGFSETKPELFSGKYPLVNIDHHISNELFGTINLVDAKASSTTAVLFTLFTLFGWRISPDMATCLLNGLMTDTGSFQHTNTTPETLRIGAKLLSAGADLESIRRYVFRTTPVETMRLWGKILSRAEKTAEDIVVSSVREEDFQRTGADPKDAAGAIDYLNMIPNAKYSILLTERGGKVKGSLRTQQDSVNVSEIAGKFGGGGHIKAAGFTVPGVLRMERRFSIISEEKTENILQEAKVHS